MSRSKRRAGLRPGLRLVAFWLGLSASLPGGAPARAEGTLTPEQEQRVRSGEIVVRIDATDRPVVVVGLVDASPDRTFGIYADFANYRSIFGLTESEVTQQAGNRVQGRFAVDFPWPFGRRWALNETVVDPGRHRFTFRRREGSFKIYEGSLQVLPESENRSRVIYAARIDPDLPVPPWLVQWAQERVFPNVIRNVRGLLAKRPDKSE